MLRRTLTFLLLLFITLSAQAQVIATTEDGKKVVLKSDGTWVTLEEYTKSLTGEAPTTENPKKEAEAAPEVKTYSMKDFECDEVSIERINPQSQEMEKSLPEIMLISEEKEQRKFSMNLRVNRNKTFIWDFQIRGQQGCAAQTPQVLVNFTDGSSIKLKVQNDFVCDQSISLFLSKGLGNKNDLKTLRTKPISMITVEARGEMIEENLDSRQAAMLQKAFNCMNGK